MDTRAKILDSGELRAALRRLESAGKPVRVVAGYFDPVLAPHARRLAELASGGAMIAVVADPPRPLLPARARAELVAALGVVDYVVLAEDAERAGLFTGLPADAVFQEQAEDQRRTRELTEHVRRRHQSA